MSLDFKAISFNVAEKQKKFLEAKETYCYVVKVNEKLT